MTGPLRLFVALTIPPEVKAALGRLRGDLEPGLPSLRWVRPEGLHLTLAFLGDVGEVRLERLCHALAGCPGATEPFRLEAAGLGVFPHLRSPRIFWAGFHRPPDPLYHLQQSVEGAMEGEGFPRERRAFRSHLTVARVRRPLRRDERELLAACLADHAEKSFGGFTVSRLSLFSSTLLPTGARYQEVDGWPLGPSGNPDEVKES